jgi:hypothetical protein
MGKRRLSPAVVAAGVNAAVTLILPAVFVGIVGFAQRYDRYNYSTTVHPPDWSPWVAALKMLGSSALFMSPFGLIAGWRTWAHARGWPDDRGWQGVAEAAGCGLAVALLALWRGIVTRPLEALPYVVVYGGLGLAVGLVAGLCLWITAAIVLRLMADRIAD